MGNLPVKYGFIASGLSIGISILLYLIDPEIYLKFNIIPQYIIEIYFMTFVVSIVKEDNGGFIKFSEAFRSAWLTYILAATLIALFTYLMMNFIDPNLIERLKVLQVEAVESVSKWGKLSEEELNEQVEIINSTNPYDIKSIAALPVSFLFPGAIIAAIIAIIKRREPIITNV